MDNNEIQERHMGDPIGTLMKTNSVIRVDGNKGSEGISKYLIKRCAELGINKVSYDVVYGKYPEDLRYSEFFAGLGGLQIGPCDGSLVRRMYSRKYDTSSNIDFAEALDLNTNLVDKYVLHSYPIEFLYKGVVILPGSNLLEQVIDKGKLNAAACLGAKVKLHPLTREEHIKFLTNQYYEAAIIPTKYSGYSCILNTNLVYATGSSELGLYAMLLGKTVVDIGTGTPVGGYADSFARVIDAPNQKDELNLLLNNPASGIILPHTCYKKQVDEYLDIYLEMLSTHKGAYVPPLSRFA